MSENKIHFDDMWLALEQELTQFDSFNPSEFSSSQSGNSSSSSSDALNPSNNSSQNNLQHSTYEELLQLRDQPNPSSERLHSDSRQERITAIKELYNKSPTIIYAKLERVADNLYKKGLVKQGNSIKNLMDKLQDQQEITTLRELISETSRQYVLNGLSKKRIKADFAKRARLDEVLKTIEPAIVEFYYDYTSNQVDLNKIDQYQNKFKIIEDNIDSLNEDVVDFKEILIPYFRNLLDIWSVVRSEVDNAVENKNFFLLDTLRGRYKADIDLKAAKSNKMAAEMQVGANLKYIDEAVEKLINSLDESDMPLALTFNTEQYRALAEKRFPQIKKEEEKLSSKINTSIMRLQELAKKLDKKGQVKSGNLVRKSMDQMLTTNISFTSDDNKYSKSFEANEQNNEKQIIVEITDKENKSTIKKEFDNLSEALEFFTHPTSEQE